MTVLGALTRTSPEVQNLTTWGDWSGDAKETWSGANVSHTSALQLLTVFGCVQFIANGIATLPVDAFRRGPAGSEPIKTPALVARPTSDLDFTGWATQALSSLLVAGNFYCYLGRRNGRLAELTPLDPTTVSVRRERGRKVFVVNGEEFSTLEIGHVPGIMWAGSDVGLSPLEAARQTIGQGMSAQEYAARFFAQDSTPGGVIEVPGEMTPEKTREMARAWQKKHAGKGKAGLPGVLQGGATWKPTAVTNEQAQFLESRKFTATEIAGEMFLIDPTELGLPVDGTSLTYANIEQRNTRKVQVTFLPWITRLESFLSSQLAESEYVKLNVNGLLRGDLSARFSSYQVASQIGLLTVDEMRALEDFPALSARDRKEQRAWQEVGLPALVEGGLMTVNEARSQLGLPPVAGGDVPRDPTEEVA